MGFAHVRGYETGNSIVAALAASGVDTLEFGAIPRSYSLRMLVALAVPTRLLAAAAIGWPAHVPLLLQQVCFERSFRAVEYGVLRLRTQHNLRIAVGA